MVSCQEPSPLKGSKHSYQCCHHDAVLVNALSFVSMGVEARCRPCHSAAHLQHMKRQASFCHCHPRCWRCNCDRCCHLHHHCQLRCHCRCLCQLPLPLAICHCGCHQPSLPLSLLRCHQPSLLPLPSPSAIAVSVTIGHRSCHLHQASPSLLPLAISKSCCFGMARIVFDQLKQRMLTLFFMFGQWAVHWSKLDVWPGVKWQWPTPVLVGERRAASG